MSGNASDGTEHGSEMNAYRNGYHDAIEDCEEAIQEKIEEWREYADGLDRFDDDKSKLSQLLHYKNASELETILDRSLEPETDCETVPDWKCANCGNRPRLKFKSEPGNCAHCGSNDWVDDRTQDTATERSEGSQ